MCLNIVIYLKKFLKLKKVYAFDRGKEPTSFKSHNDDIHLEKMRNLFFSENTQKTLQILGLKPVVEIYAHDEKGKWFLNPVHHSLNSIRIRQFDYFALSLNLVKLLPSPIYDLVMIYLTQMSYADLRNLISLAHPMATEPSRIENFTLLDLVGVIDKIVEIETRDLEDYKRSAIEAVAEGEAEVEMQLIDDFGQEVQVPNGIMPFDGFENDLQYIQKDTAIEIQFRRKILDCLSGKRTIQSFEVTTLADYYEVNILEPQEVLEGEEEEYVVLQLKYSTNRDDMKTILCRIPITDSNGRNNYLYLPVQLNF